MKTTEEREVEAERKHQEVMRGYRRTNLYGKIAIVFQLIALSSLIYAAITTHHTIAILRKLKSRVQAVEQTVHDR